MSIVTLQISPETRLVLQDRAARRGLSLEAFLEQLIDSAASNGPAGDAHKPTFDEIATPIREAFRESGMTDAELAGLVEEAREEVWREKHGGKPT